MRVNLKTERIRAGWPEPKDEARFWSKVIVVDNCWQWAGVITKRGYSRFQFGGRMTPAHRVAYEWYAGAVPAGFTLDHLCRNRSCVKPAHLEIVTPRENTLRGTSPSAVCARKAECVHGHPFSEDNTRRRSDGRRRCRVCQKAAEKKYKHRIRAKGVVG